MGSAGGSGAAVAAHHSRHAPLRSIGLRILVPVLLATSAVVVLGVLQTRGALAESAEAGDARVLARTASAGMVLAHRAELEYAETNALRLRGGQAGSQLLAAQQARTDAAREAYADAAAQARRVAPSLAPVLDAADAVLDVLPGVRTTAVSAPDGSADVFAAYDAVARVLIAVADAVPVQLADPELVASARAAVLVTELEHRAAQQLDLLRRIFTRQSLAPGELITLAGWAGAEAQLRESLERLPGPAARRFATLVSGPDVGRARELRDAVLNSTGAAAALRVDPDVWYAAQSGLLRQLRLTQIELSVTMEDDAYEIQAAAHRRTLVTGVLTGLVVALALAGATVLAVRTSRRLRRMRATALTVAHRELPDAVFRVATATDETSLQAELEASGSRVETMLAHGRDPRRGADEIGELAASFATVHRQALRLAADQALLRMEMGATFTALSRRGQTLVQRQLHLIDDFSRTAADPDSRARLLALDHLAARMRRNEENLLVMAGGDPGRRFTEPVAMRDLIRLATAEIEEPGRVEAVATPLVAVAAHVVGDVVHLLAELLENATNFSPPTTLVRVAARQAVDHVTLTIFDEGIGLPQGLLAEANDRIARPSALTSSLVGTMGLLVVGRLAARRGIRVRLTSVAGGGTAATVTLPDAVLAPLPPPGRFHGGQFAAPALSPAPAAPYRVGLLSPSSPPPAPLPAGPLPPASLPAGSLPAAPVPASLAGTTPAGLPRRAPARSLPAAAPAALPPGAPAVPPAAAGPPALPVGPVAGRPLPPAALDPDEVRARLSSLASGIAAGRRTAPPTPPAAPATPVTTSPPQEGIDEQRYGLPSGPRRLR